MIYKSYIVEKKADPNTPELSKVTITTSHPDRSGDIIRPKGIDLTDYLKNSLVLFQHGRDLRIGARSIGKTHNIEVRNNRIDTEFEWDLEDPEVVLLKHKWDADFIKGASVGIVVKEAKEIEQTEEEKKNRWFPPIDIIKSSLIEWSIVSIPMNNQALKRRSMEELQELSEFIPSIKSFITKDENYLEFKTKLNAIENIVTRLGDSFQLIMCEHGYLYNKDVARCQDCTNKTDETYKPYTSWLQANKSWNGATTISSLKECIAAMVVFNATKGMDISEEDKTGAYTYILKHYKQFNEVPPERKEWSLNECHNYLEEKGFARTEIADVLQSCQFSFGEILTVLEHTQNPDASLEEVQTALEEKEEYNFDFSDLMKDLESFSSN